MYPHHSKIQLCLGILTLICTGSFAAGGEEEPTSAADVGKALFERNCAACHGQSGRGTGDFAGLLKQSPMDLTGIAARRDGDFPSLEIAEIIDGRRTPRAHGSADMPIWGDRLSEYAPGGQGADVAVRGQIYLLVEYLRSIQSGVVQAEPETPEVVEEKRQTETKRVAQVGEQQFRRDCAACHGVDGKGGGYVGQLLETPPANLRTIAKRNGGTFPGLKIAETIDGRRDVKAHGPRDMPVWGKRFAETKPSGVGKQAAIRGEVMLYVTYLRSIQEP